MEVYSTAPVSDKTSTLLFITYYIIVQMGTKELKNKCTIKLIRMHRNLTY